MKTFLPTFVFTFIILLVSAQKIKQYPDSIELRIKQVEQNLGEAIKTSDNPIYLNERMKEYNIAGLSIAVIKNYKIDWAKAYGFADKERQILATTETLFQAASISKSLNALGILKLAEQNKLNLEKDINLYLKDWKYPYDTSKKKSTITLRQLLSHTAGTSVSGFRGYENKDSLPDIKSILDGKYPANNRPVRSVVESGLKTQYSGGGIAITQLIITDVTGQSYEAFMKKNILLLLGMKNSFFNAIPPTELEHKLATGYRKNGTSLTGKYHYYPEMAAASLWTTPSELSNFLIELQKAFAGKSKKIINQSIATEMLSSVKENYALGTFIQNKGNEKYFNHSGANEGFRSYYICSLSGGNGVVVFVNSENDAIIPEIVNSVASVYDWKDFYNPVIRRMVSVPSEVLETYTGVYEINNGLQIKITSDKEGLKAKATNQPEFPLFAETESKFFFNVVEATIEFVRDESGNVTKMVLYQNGQAITATKK